MTTEQTQPVIFVIAFGSVVFYLVAVFYMFNYLKRIHPDAWNQIGRPSFLNNSIQNNFLFFGFMIHRKYLALGDPRLNQLCLLIWVLFGVAFVFVVENFMNILH